jgi:hypothetical protein
LFSFDSSVAVSFASAALTPDCVRIRAFSALLLKRSR